MVSSEETFCIPENGAYTEKTTSPAVEEQIAYAEGETSFPEDIQPEENEFTDVPWYCYSLPASCVAATHAMGSRFSADRIR